MATDTVLPQQGGNVAGGRDFRSFARPMLLVLAFLVLAIPTAITLADQVWSTDAGAHAPIVIASGAWLIYRCLGQIRARAVPGNSLVLGLMLLLAIPLYVFGRAYDFISLETLGLYIVGVALSYHLIGWQGIKYILFPLVYLAFLIPPPGWFIVQLTGPLRTFVSYVSTEGLHRIGYPVAREGIVIFIAQYQLLVEEACSGMNSIVGLVAVSLFYIYVLHNASRGYALLLVALIVPIAIVTNIVRIVVLVLLTYYYGDAVAQGFLHGTAGIMLFAFALLLVFLLDSVLIKLFHRRQTAAGAP
jgi:exosortase